MTIRVVGLRGLKSLGMLPIGCRFLRFNLNGLKTNYHDFLSINKKYLDTEIKSFGSNPDISTILKLIIYC